MDGAGNHQRRQDRVPDWSNGVNIGNLIKGYHEEFFDRAEEGDGRGDAGRAAGSSRRCVTGKGVVRLEGDLEVWLNGVQDRMRHRQSVQDHQGHRRAERHQG